ncbi:MAG: high-affinity nickel-transporter [Roseiflexaceae bacterium]
MCKPHAGRKTRAVWLCRWALAALTLLVTLAVPLVTLAHPLGNFTVNHYSRLELSLGKARIFYVLDMAEIPTFQTIQQIDHNGNQQIDADEGAAFASTKMDEIRQNLRFTLNDTAIDLQASGAPELTFPPGQGGLSLLRLTFWLDGSLPTGSRGAVVAAYQDNNELERIGWREIVIRGQDGLKIFDSTVSDKDQSNELRTYPQDMLTSPLNETSARFSFQPGGSQTASQVGQSAPLGSAANDGAFAALITLPTLDLRVVLLALVTALGLGALHALEPGHGKTAAAAYLVGARATPRHAVALGFTITAMHTSSVFILGLVTLFASQYILPEKLLPYLGLGSGLIVIFIGLRMFLSRLRSGDAESAHSQGSGHDHDNGHPHEHSHDHDHGHSHLPPTLTGDDVSWRGVMAIGISGGLLPCPAALVVLLSAIGLGRLGFGMLLIIAFSGGLALVLSGIGLTVLYGGRWLSRHQLSDGFAQNRMVVWAARSLPAFSSLLVVGAGFLLLYHALPLLRIWQL